MSPESLQGRDIISIVGYCSTGKSRLARELTANLNGRISKEQSGEQTARFLSVGNIFRLLAGLPNIPMDTPDMIQQTAREALSVVHTEVDPATGEILLKPNGLATFLQTHKNGIGASPLGANPHMSEFVFDFVTDLLEKHIPVGGIGVVDGRQIYGRNGNGVGQEPNFDVTIIPHADLPVRTQFYEEERQVFTGIEEALSGRDEFDGPILSPALLSTEHVISLERTDASLEATKQVSEHIGGVIYDFRNGTPPTDDFDSIPIHMSDK